MTVYAEAKKRYGMMFLTAANRKALPALGATANIEDKVAVVKFFDPSGSFTWYAMEFDGDDTFFGLVDGNVDENGIDFATTEMGYFRLSELMSIKGRFGLGIERDRHFGPTLLSTICSS